MKKRKLSLYVSFVFGVFVVYSFIGAMGQSNRAEQLHQEALVWDAHSDLVHSIMLQGLDITKKNNFSFGDVPRMEEGGVDVLIFALCPDPVYFPRGCARRTLQMLDAMMEAIRSAPDKIELARTASDIERITQSGKITVLLAIEGGHAIEDDLGLLRDYHRLGVTSMTLTHSITNNWADSSSDEARWGGLNELGEKVVREMNRLGMVIDVSHVSDETFYDVIRISKDPVIASHSNCRTLCDHGRNMSDDMIKTLAGNGGVICITFVPGYTTQKFKDARAIALKEAEKRAAKKEETPLRDLDELAKERQLAPRIMPDIPFPTIDNVLDQVDYAVKLVGVDHVGIGSDYSIMYRGPKGLEDVSQYLNLTKGLLSRGYSEQDIKKILGENLLRIWRQVTEK
ncbi:MAG: dipeptidase [Acidobacteriota bacterium]